MKKETKTIDLSKGATLFEMFDYLCSRVNWGKSALDNEGVVCMDTLSKELRKQTDKIKL